MFSALFSFLGGSVFRLYRAPFVNLALRIKVCGFGLIFRIVKPKIVSHPICVFDFCRKFLCCAVIVNTKRSSSIIDPWAAKVLHVDLLANASKIIVGVVQRIAVDVVNMLVGPLSSHVKNGAAVRVMLASSDADFPVSVPLDPPRNITGLRSPGFPAARENSRYWIVVQEAAELIRSKIVSSHRTFLSSCGQKPGVDSQSTPVSSLYRCNYA